MKALTMTPADESSLEMGRTRFEVADIFRQYGPAYRATHPLTPEQAQAMRDIERCRTVELGGHLERCDACGFERPAYNSCRNRNCPKCQGLQKAQWLEQRMDRLLPTPYFHSVVTLPHDLNPLMLYNQELSYNLLFHSASQALKHYAATWERLRAEVGFTAALHTWDQEMGYHVHLHLVSTGGGLDPSGTRWVSSHTHFLVPNRGLAKRVRQRFLQGLQAAYDEGTLAFPQKIHHLQSPKAFARLLRKAGRKKWVVYTKPPFGGPEQVFQYLGEYTHRVALSNSRLQSLADARVTFTARDNDHPGAKRPVTLTAEQFIQRFLLHILPKGFVRIRHYGLLASRNVHTKLAQARRLLQQRQPQSAGHSSCPDAEPKPKTWQEWMLKITGIDVTLCPRCKTGQLIRRPLPPQSAPAPPHLALAAYYDTS
jgi:hypothetical protein